MRLSLPLLRDLVRARITASDGINLSIDDCLVKQIRLEIQLNRMSAEEIYRRFPQYTSDLH